MVLDFSLKHAVFAWIDSNEHSQHAPVALSSQRQPAFVSSSLPPTSLEFEISSKQQMHTAPQLCHAAMTAQTLVEGGTSLLVLLRVCTSVPAEGALDC
eukprot:941676-Amphidinium_carterae.2